ncbi:N-acetylglucosamine-6-phosphate deacetylase [Actinocatenispora rupis]|uniref:N-acetylglucosamine-6-phosphate deacetylase n=1 Tax=Actinocatenispora rupis TaxID=519421 RepID=A0A8J3NCT4_9ACTN|nr:amidohydrolase family protein [Actinocatenispora rupis]GID10799.1 N-acetylglucosamine-6-phosphate deacetylase [Actinocatenispora rupis]
MARYAIVGGRLVGARRVESDRAVLVRDGRVEALPPYAEVPPGVRRIDVAGRYVSPGLVDIHAHGAAGHTFDDADATGYDAVLAGHARYGVTAMLASLASARPADLADRLRFAAAHQARTRAGARLLGAHLEGPFLAPEQAGAHRPDLLVEPTPPLVRQLLPAGAEPAMVTLAPELPGGIAAVAAFRAAGTVVAAGHSAADARQLDAARSAGLSHLSHLWSGQSGLRRDGPWRVPGLVEESLASTGLTAEVIADGRHLPPALLRIALRCLPDRLCVVSDATAGAGLPAGSRYRLAGNDCVVADGVGVVVGQDAFAGSTTGLDAMVRHLHTGLDVPLPAAIGMATTVPSRVLGLPAPLSTGAPADVAVFDDDLTVRATVVGGDWRYDPYEWGESR